MTIHYFFHIVQTKIIFFCIGHFRKLVLFPYYTVVIREVLLNEKIDVPPLIKIDVPPLLKKIDVPPLIKK
jgi:hypothetical protein